MKTHIFICMTLHLCALPVLGWSASCSRANLTRCLDSACAINISANPAARCQYCGTPDAGIPTASKMRSVSTGSTKYNISDKELKSAPSDPGARYVWATKKCLEILPDCVPDDVTDTYDSLIEQSCTAACNNHKLAQNQTKLAQTKSATECDHEITSCVTDDKNCSSDYSNCGSDSDFARVFSQCSAGAPGCTQYTANIRSALNQVRADLASSMTQQIQSIVKAYAQNRESTLSKIQQGCLSETARESCIETACANNTRNNCADANEKTIAISLCKFYDTACGTIK